MKFEDPSINLNVRSVTSLSPLPKAKVPPSDQLTHSELKGTLLK